MLKMIGTFKEWGCWCCGSVSFIPFPIAGPKSCQDEAEAKSNKYHLSRDDESDNAIGSKNPASSLVSAELREEVRRLVRQLFERLRSRETCSRSESRVIKCPRSEGYKNAVPNHNSDELSCQKEVMGDRAGSQAPGKLANRIEKFKKRRSHKPARVKVLNARELAHIKRELCESFACLGGISVLNISLSKANRCSPRRR